MTIKALEGFKERVESTLEESGCPGMSVAIVKDDRVVFAGSFGLRDAEKGLPVTADTLFAIGSCSKAFVSMSAALMVEEGKLEWDRPVTKYLPGFRMYDPVATERLTLRDMLTHRSGLPRHEMVWYGSPLSREELIERIQYLEPNKDLRVEAQYNNLLYMTAGYLAGKVVKKSWEDLVSERIFQPLGMKRSNFSVETSQEDDDHALPYQKIDDEVKRVPFRNIDAVGPAGSINSSALEMANWLIMHLNGGKFGETRLLSEAVFNEMHAPQIVMPGTITEIVKDHAMHWLYAMGWWTTSYRGHEFWLHEGGIDGFSACTYMLPRLGIGVAMLSNLGTNLHAAAIVLEALDRMAGLEYIDWLEPIREMMKKMKEASEEGEKEEEKGDVVAPPTHDLEYYAGTYDHPGYGLVRVEVEGDGLVIHVKQESLPLMHCCYDIFEFNLPAAELRFKVKFNMDHKGSFDSLSIPFQAGVADIVFVRQADEKLKERSFLEQFAGEYELMGMILSISVRGEGLLASLPGQGDIELAPYQGTTFNAKGMPVSVTFKLGEDGAVVEAQVDQAGMVLTAKRK